MPRNKSLPTDPVLVSLIVRRKSLSFHEEDHFEYLTYFADALGNDDKFDGISQNICFYSTSLAFFISKCLNKAIPLPDACNTVLL